VAGGIALTGAIVAAALTVTASTSPPAYALVVNPNGSVSLTINELIGITGANAELARLGVRARVARIEPHCTAAGDHVAFPRPHLGSVSSHDEIGAAGMVEAELLPRGWGPFGRLRMAIHPGAIPQGDTLLLTVRAMTPTYHGDPIGAVGMSMGLYRGPAPACVS